VSSVVCRLLRSGHLLWQEPTLPSRACFAEYYEQLAAIKEDRHLVNRSVHLVRATWSCFASPPGVRKQCNAMHFRHRENVRVRETRTAQVLCVNRRPVRANLSRPPGGRGEKRSCRKSKLVRGTRIKEPKLYSLYSICPYHWLAHARIAVSLA
jgi:hypothetical protein